MRLISAACSSVTAVSFGNGCFLFGTTFLGVSQGPISGLQVQAGSLSHVDRSGASFKPWDLISFLAAIVKLLEFYVKRECRDPSMTRSS